MIHKSLFLNLAPLGGFCFVRAGHFTLYLQVSGYPSYKVYTLLSCTLNEGNGKSGYLEQSYGEKERERERERENEVAR